MTEAELDRLGELANIGAGHAADAFAQLVGRSMRMHVPRVLEGPEARRTGEDFDGGWSTGVFFEFDGCLDALVGILFREGASEAVVRSVVGEPDSDHQLPLSSVESALMEVGNILASHVASAIADTLGERLLPSIPMLAMESAGETLRDLVAAREGACARIECELSDDAGELGGLLVLVPRAEKAA